MEAKAKAPSSSPSLRKKSPTPSGDGGGGGGGSRHRPVARRANRTLKYNPDDAKRFAEAIEELRGMNTDSSRFKGLRPVAKKYNIDHTLLLARARKVQKHAAVGGTGSCAAAAADAASILSHHGSHRMDKTMEDQLLEWILEAGGRGRVPRVAEIVVKAEELLRAAGDYAPFHGSWKWWFGFRKRHGERLQSWRARKTEHPSRSGVAAESNAAIRDSASPVNVLKCSRRGGGGGGTRKPRDIARAVQDCAASLEAFKYKDVVARYGERGAYTIHKEALIDLLPVDGNGGWLSGDVINAMVELLNQTCEQRGIDVFVGKTEYLTSAIVFGMPSAVTAALTGKKPRAVLLPVHKTAGAALVDAVSSKRCDHWSLAAILPRQRVVIAADPMGGARKTECEIEALKIILRSVHPPGPPGAPWNFGSHDWAQARPSGGGGGDDEGIQRDTVNCGVWLVTMLQAVCRGQLADRDATRESVIAALNSIDAEQDLRAARLDIAEAILESFRVSPPPRRRATAAPPPPRRSAAAPPATNSVVDLTTTD